jgi:hypothetical protein
MKKAQVLLFLAMILVGLGWRAPVAAQDIPVNYIQNPNMEHELNATFWYGGYDDTYYGIYSHPWDYLTTDDAHSGNQCMKIWVLPGGEWGTWVWVSYPVRGHEQKKFKASFWYKGYFLSYWNFIYRDVGMTFEDLHPSLAEYIGADTAYYDPPGQDALKFDFGGEDGYTEDWTYFEFVWDFPGTIPGWGNTSMWYANRDPAYIDDLYYGEWYDGHYSGEEPLGFINGDFEKSALNTEWTVNAGIGGAVEPSDFLSLTENHTEAGSQSLRLMDYMSVNGDGDTTLEDKDVFYYIPAMGAEGKDMEMEFWYKGNDASLDLFFYDDYGITPAAFPLPSGTQLLARETIVDTTDIIVDSTIVYDYENPVSSDTANVLQILGPVVVDSENFDDVSGTPALMDWNWSGWNYFGYNDWPGQIVEDEAFSGSKSLWFPGDPNWTGAEGTLPGIEDNGAYSLSFMYKGKLQLVMKFGESLKYDLEGDPDGIVPEGASVSGDQSSIEWALDSDHWKKFSFSWEVGTWLADSGVASPAGLVYDLVGTYTQGDVGYVDDLAFSEVVVPVDVLAEQDFDGLDGAQPLPLDWNWSGSNFFGYNDWAGEMVDDESYSAPTSFWLPGDPNWTGSEGTIAGIVDSAAYSVSFMYKGKLQFILDMGDLTYDLDGDPDGIIPAEATIDGRTLLWNLASTGWKKFSYAWEQGSWLADSAAASPASMNFSFVGTYTDGDNGYVDDLLVQKSREKLGAESLIESAELIYAVYGIDTILYDTTFVTETSSNDVLVDADSELAPLAIHWMLPAAADWTQWKLNWTNPSSDIGSTLTMKLDNEITASPDWITPEKEIFDDANAGWTYFDDFVYGIAEPIGIETNMVRYDLYTYPNPASDVLYLSIQIPLNRIEVYNSLGQLQMDLDHPDRVLDIAMLNDGMYLINATDEQGIIHKAKFIKR